MITLPHIFRISLFIVAAILLATSSGCSLKENNDGIDQPLFVDIFVAGQEDITGYNDEPYAKFREQNVVVTNSGSIVTVVQGRNSSDWCDRSGQDLWCKISTDNGLTWSEPVLIDDQGEKSIVPNASVYDKETGRILTLYSVVQWPFTDAESRFDWGEGSEHEEYWEGSHYRQYVVHSDDGGYTWSEPRDISSMVKDPSVIQIFGSGEGIQLKNSEYKGRLIVPGGDFQEPYKRVFAWISDDHGETWQAGNAVPNPHNRITPCENAIVELSDGTLLMNQRSHDPGNRWKSYSSDGGETWSPFEMIEDMPSVSCNASIIRVNHKGTDVLLYAGPVGPNPYTTEGEYAEEFRWAERRVNGVLFASTDNGKTWPFRRVLVPGKFAYSSLVELEDGDIGLFYESNNHHDIRLLKFSLDWLFECLI